MTAGSRNVDNLHALIKSMQQGDKDAFGILYDKYAPSLLGLLNGLLNDTRVSEEVLHQSFVSMWRLKSTYDDSVNTVFTWMVHITRKTAIEVMGDLLNPDTNNAGRKISLPGKINERKDKMAGPPLQSVNEALHLVLIKGYSYDKAAFELNLPVEVLKIRIRSAIKQTAASIL